MLYKIACVKFKILGVSWILLTQDLHDKKFVRKIRQLMVQRNRKHTSTKKQVFCKVKVNEKSSKKSQFRFERMRDGRNQQSGLILQLGSQILGKKLVYTVRTVCVQCTSQ